MQICLDFILQFVQLDSSQHFNQTDTFGIEGMLYKTSLKSGDENYLPFPVLKQLNFQTVLGESSLNSYLES